jgi:hemolysin activation/secretion protein
MRIVNSRARILSPQPRHHERGEAFPGRGDDSCGYWVICASATTGIGTIGVTGRTCGLGVALLCSAGLAVPGASAQVRPGTTQPGQVERQLKKPPEPSAKPGAVQIREAGRDKPPNADSIRFVLNRLTVDGSTVYAPDTLRPLYAKHFGTEVTLAQIYGIVDALTARYRNDGYILSQVIVPAQAVEEGAIRLQAIEGYVDDVRVEGGTAAVRARAQKYADRLKRQRPLTAATLERNVLLLNDLPGVEARAVLAPGRAPGAAQLVLQLTERRYGASASSDTRGSRAQGRQRIFADVDLHNLFGGASTTELRQVTTFTPELTYVGAAHDQFVGTHGGSISLAGTYTYSKPQELLFIPLELTTQSTTLTLAYSHPILRSRGANLHVRGSLSLFDSTSKVFGVRDTTDRLRPARVGLTYDVADRLGGINIADLEYSLGIDGLGASSGDDPYLSRPGGRPDFQKVAFYGARFQMLPAGWSIGFAGAAQYAFTDLLSPELFSVGGEQFGRAYDPSELLGDHGVSLRIDFGHTHVWRSRHPISLLPYVFADAGRVWVRTDLPGSDSRQTATSAGAGLRLNIGAQMGGFVELAKPLDRIVVQERTRDLRIFAGLSIH